MKPVPAIVEPAQVDVDLVAEQILVAAADLSRVANSIVRLRGQLEDAIATAKMRRIEIGRLLARVRPTWPKRGPNAKGWGEFLARVKLDDSTAYRYIEEFKDPDGFAQRLSGKPAEDNDSDDAVSENGERDDKPTLSLVPDPEPEIDRDTWCTPKWITDAIGEFDLDPCSNERSHVRARAAFCLERDQDGLLLAEGHADDGTRAFINPPYSDVPPWVAAYKHTRFCFLLKLDTSTKWFAELYAATALILIPRRRVNFEPPPGVPPEKAVAQQFPHALFYAHAEDATPAIRGLCWAWRVDTTNT